MGELGLGLGVADLDRTARGFPPRRDVDRGREVDYDPSAPAGKAEGRGGDDLDAEPVHTPRRAGVTRKGPEDGASTRTQSESKVGT